jgi:hypothetical protein
MVTAPQLLGIARIQATTLVSRLGRRLQRAVFLTETPRDVIFVALDIVGFGKCDLDAQTRLRERLYSAVKVIRHGLGNLIPYAVLDRGDGVVVLFPEMTDAARLLGEALPGLASKVDGGNRSSAGDKMILRCVVHKGKARRDRWGWVGNDVNVVFRLLDSRTLKLRLRKGEHPSPVTAALSQSFFHAVCQQLGDEQQLHNRIKQAWHDSLVMHTFRAKEVEQHAWFASVSVTDSHPGHAPKA